MRLIGESFAGVATASTRIIELYYPPEKRIVNDPYALKLLPFGWRVLVRLLFLPGLRGAVLALRERRMPGSLGAILCRARCIDDHLVRSLQTGLDQVVILGAGFDSRAYRIPGMEQVRVFEVDLPGTRRLKQTRVEAVLGAVPGNVTLVGMNFEEQDLGAVLDAAGFQRGARTFYIWEGVTQYLTAEAVEATFEFVSGTSGPGSVIAFTYIRQAIIDGTERPEWFAGFLKFASQVGSPLRFGLNPPDMSGYLAARGLKLVADVGAAEYRELYLLPLGRDLAVFDAERVALARVSAA